MNIYAKRGTKVRYLGENGYDFQRAKIEQAGVRAGDILTIRATDVHDCYTDAYFEEVSGYHNSVMFEDVEDEGAL